MSSNDFDRVAPFYDALAGLVFGKAIKKAQTKYLHLIKPNLKILILGGGTGWIIDEILNRQSTIEITYIEKSTQMIDLAKKVSSNPTIKFVNCPFEEWQSEDKFDFVISNFFLDVFQRTRIEEEIIPKIKSLIAENGILLVADFQGSQSIWQKVLLWIMHRFFALSSNMENSELNDLNAIIVSNGFRETSVSYRFKEMIFSRVYELEK